MPFTGDAAAERGHDPASSAAALVVVFEYLRGWARFRFRWQERGDAPDRRMTIRASPAAASTSTSINYLNGRARLTAGYIDQDRNRTAWRRLTSLERPTLDRIDLMEYSADVAVAGEPLWCENPDYD